MPIPTKTRLELRLLARQLSDMENSTFISDAEFNTYLNLGLQELYDLFAEVHGQEFFLKTQAIQLLDNIAVYTLNDDFHVLKGVDWLPNQPPVTSYDYDIIGGVEVRYPFGSLTPTIFNPSTFSRSLWVPDGLFDDQVVPLKPYTFFERHDGSRVEQMGLVGERLMKFRVFTERQEGQSKVFTGGGDPTSGPTAPGPGVSVTTTVGFVHRIRFNPLGSGWALVWYLPSPPSLTSDTSSMVGFHGYEEYVSLFAAIRALRKEESDWASLSADLEAMKTRIRNMGSNRDMGHPSRVQDMTQSGY
jgi:hypothetical protein